MNHIIADYIITPLANGTEANLAAVTSGRTEMKKHADRFPSVEPFCASVFDNVQNVNGFSKFESLCIEAVRYALFEKGLKIADSTNTVFIVSTTKGNVEFLTTGGDTSLVVSACKIAAYFNNPNAPLVVSNACVSGVCALITAMRLLEAQQYTNAVIVGCDVLSPFIISGFQSLKALSAHPCRPFDAQRDGLNLGEAAACVVMTADSRYSSLSLGSVMRGAIHNDANHISGPSRTGEGSLRCLQDMEADPHNLAFVNVHGTATAYNDEMESIALTRAGWQDVPVNALKAYFGHTLGAAGLLETILSLHALRQGYVLATKGYQEQGTTRRLNICTDVTPTGKTEFVKLLSGFGGCNAAIKVALEGKEQASNATHQALKCMAEVRISPASVTVNGKELNMSQQGESLLTEIYKMHVNDYPKFYKMDTLSRLGFVATELLIQYLEEERFVDREDRAVVFANRSSSLKNDTDYQQSIRSDDYFPSPSLFVYTLPNIVTGEIAIRNKYYGETSFYVLDSEKELLPLAESALQQRNTTSVLAGWTECTGPDQFDAHVMLLTNQE